MTSETTSGYFFGFLANYAVYLFLLIRSEKLGPRTQRPSETLPVQEA